jgi:hypothetical protein
MKLRLIHVLALVVPLVAVVLPGAAMPADGNLRQGKRAIVIDAAASYVEVTPRALVGELRSGRSLAQVAAARGKPVDGLKRAIVAAFDARLSRAVAADRITAEQKASLLARVEARLDRLINRVWRARR